MPALTEQMMCLQLASTKLQEAARSFENEGKQAQTQLASIQQSLKQKEEELYTKVGKRAGFSSAGHDSAF